MNYSVLVLEPAKEFLSQLEPKLRAKAFRTIGLLADFGQILSLPHSRKIAGTEKLYELRVKQATNICRLFYFFKGSGVFVVLSGFVKKTDRTDRNEIERAQRLMQQFMEEEDEHGKNL
ncbi:MAG: type II toxin-antitoxin system RelE/ParE family toxin [Spirochaetota bacterium]